MKQAEQGFKSFLAAQKLKYTPERRKIFQEIFLADHLFDAEQLVRQLKTHNNDVSRATVYRTLDLLTRHGLIRRVCLSDRTTLYEKASRRSHKGRLVCLSCGQVEEFGTPEIDDFVAAACKEHAFRPQNRCIQISGYCQSCQNKSLTVLHRNVN